MQDDIYFVSNESAVTMVVSGLTRYMGVKYNLFYYWCGCYVWSPTRLFMETKFVLLCGFIGKGLRSNWNIQEYDMYTFIARYMFVRLPFIIASIKSIITINHSACTTGTEP